MKEAGVIFSIRGLLNCRKKQDGELYRSNVGANYSDLIDAVFARMTWPGDKRSLNQNAILHVWFSDIAKHFGDRTAQDVKGECHRDLGLTIRLRDKQFNWVWQETGAKLNREQQAALLASGCLNLSSGMSKPELREYMNLIEQEYSPRGVALTVPEAA